ncbi:uncharacterized protein CG7065-like isoform X2 [Wyeomyia smithii]|nr:uncharacterized protein CG7065-like isoform X2 [Wyeomyia smithii]
MHIAPGEPVPPGMENEVKPVAELQTTIDKFKHGPMVGLEYIMELTTPGKKEPSYHCVLCDKKGDPRTVVVHITSHIHRVKFLEKHYPTVVNELAPYRSQRGANKEIINRVIQTVCEAIEDHHGRLTPTVHDSADYTRNKMKYLQEVIFEKHFDERTGPKFVEVIDKKMLQDQMAALQAKSNVPTPAAAAAAATTTTTSTTTETKRDPSPPVVQAPQKKARPIRADRKSLDSISSSDSVQSISSEDSTKLTEQPPAGRYGDSSQASRSRPPAAAPVPRSFNRGRSPLPFRRGAPPHRRSPVPRSRYDRRSRSPPPRRRSRSPPPRRRSRSPVRRRSPIRSDRSPLRFNDRRSPSPGSKKCKALPTPKQLSLQASEIAHERYKWEKYRCSLEIAIALIDKSFKEHEKNPEKHPQYPEEWKMFWNRRYKELQNEKKDPSKHDFKPEWIVFWTKRMKELRDEEIEQKKVEIKKKLNLPDEGAEKTAELKEQYALKVNKKKRALGSPIESSDDEKMSVKSRESVKVRSTRTKQSKSPLSDDDFEERSRHSSSRAYSREQERDRDRNRERDWEMERGRSRPLPMHVQHDQDYDEWAKSYYGPNKKVFVRKEFDNDSSGPLNFVAVCRLLTALEEYLGPSLGPKIIDLLSKALALEKVKANSADDLLLNEDNCMFLETVKEKLKGHLMGNLVENQKIAAVKKAIKNIASLVHEASKKEKVEPVVEKPIVLPTAVPPTTEGGVDKAAIAQKLAAALVAQGKTDFTSEELEQLINVYVAMAEASKEKEKVVTTSSFLTDIAPTKLSAVARKPETSSQREEPSYSKDTTENTEGTALEGLTDSDLQTLLQNFKDLSNEEQLHLISHLKKLERTDPLRVEKLRRYVNLDDKPSTSNRQLRDQYSDEEDDRNFDDDEANFGDGQNFEDDVPDFTGTNALNSDSQMKSLATGAFGEKNTDLYSQKKLIDSDEEDYSYDDVVRAASKNVNVAAPKNSCNPTKGITLRKDLGGDNFDGSSNFSRASNERSSQLDTQHIIANLMGSLPKPGNAQNSSSYNNPIATIGQSNDSRQNLNYYDNTSQHSNSSFGGSYANNPQMASNGSFPAQTSNQFASMQSTNSNPNSAPYYYQQQQQQQQQMRAQQQMHPTQQKTSMGFGGQFGGPSQQGAYMWPQNSGASQQGHQQGGYYENNYY